MPSKLLVPVVVVGLFAGVLAACGGGSDAGEEPAPATTAVETQTETAATTSAAEEEPAADTDVQAGGTFRVGVENAFGFTSGFDPTGEYYAFGYGIHTNLLVRTLLGFRHVAGAPGNEPIPDLATGPPEISDDGLTWTFQLKDGIMFGPPVNREITSRDVAYAFERIGTPSVVAQYGFYYDVIEGMAEFKEGKAETISGIQTPDDKTIVFTLTAPTGDFDYRVALPAAGPIPEEVAGCFTKAGEYGRYLISSGPYMFEGSENLDISSCETMEPISGYKPNTSMTLVRNPAYDPATDTPEARENYPDRFEFVINTNNLDIYNKVEAGELEAEFASVTPKVIQRYSRDEELADRLKIYPADFMLYVTLNLTQPPFDDVHVRRAVNYVLDKEAVRRTQGGPPKGEIAHHVLPDAMVNGLMEDYDPYPSEGDAGDVAAAMEEMKLSRYDTDKDGLCDAPECKGVINLSDALEAARAVVPPIEASFEQIGIELDTKYLDDAFLPLQDVSKNFPMATFPGWIKDYADASTFMVLFDSRVIIPTGNINYSLVGLTPEQAAGLDGLDGNVEGIPSVDADIDRCTALVGDERLQCWIDLDERLMEEVVPWIPLIDRNEVRVIGPTVTKWEYDQGSANAGWAHVAVDASQQ